MIWLLTLALAGPLPAPAPNGDSNAHAPHTIVPAPLTGAPRSLSAEALLRAEHRQIRGMDRRVDALVAEGIRRSATFSRLVSDLHETDVIVYVESTFNLPATQAGRLLLQAATGARRYLRVQVRATLQKDQVLAVLAHELRHALEVAADPSVIDEQALVALYTRIGHVSAETKGYDTQAAKDAGEQVREELLGARFGSRVVRGA